MIVEFRDTMPHKPCLLHFLAYLRRFFLLGVILLFLFLFCYYRVYEVLNLPTLKKYHTVLHAWSSAHYLLSMTIYILIFTILIACAVPCATLLTLFGGFLFGAFAIPYALFSITLGGLLLLLAIRTAFGKNITLHAITWFNRIEKGFKKNAFGYLLMLRLMPIFPCWLSNISAAVFNIRLNIFLTATLLGIFPSTVIYTLAGKSLDTLFTAPSLSFPVLITTPMLSLPLLALSILSIIPIFYRQK
jgi:uncharacterized membrane protein YdjX (TVP38/TMEM64 family)